MTQAIPALSRNRRLMNRHGAVFLLAVYCTSLLLLILGGMAMQRTFVETRAAQQSTDLQRAFYSADGVMDYALAKTRRYYLDDGVCYSSVPTAGRPSLCTTEEAAHGPSFTLEPASSEIITQGKQQVLTRQIVATGVAGSEGSRRTSVVSTYVQEDGPLEGAWGSRLVAVYGGGHYGQLRDIYLKGSLRSNRGVLAAVLADPQYDTTTGAILTGKMLVTSGAVKASSWDDLVDPENDYVSSELLTVKMDYSWAHHAWGGEYQDPVDYKGVHYPGIDYVDGQHQDTFPHIDGSASIGSIKQPIISPSLLDTISPSDCTGNLALSDTFQPTSIPGNGFTADGGKIQDLSSDPNFIILCVNSIHPEGKQAWADTYYDNRPPAVKFEKPALLYVTGSKQVGASDVDPDLYQKIGGWDFAIGAKISSATDAGGKPITEGLRIAVKQPITQQGKHTIVWMKPGKFSGSIFAPESLVRVAERDSDFSDANNKYVPLHLQHLVGDEVIIELAGDELRLGALDDDRKKPDTAKTTLLGGWMNHSASGTSGTVSGTSAKNDKIPDAKTTSKSK